MKSKTLTRKLNNILNKNFNLKIMFKISNILKNVVDMYELPEYSLITSHFFPFMWNKTFKN